MKSLPKNIREDSLINFLLISSCSVLILITLSMLLPNPKETLVLGVTNEDNLIQLNKEKDYWNNLLADNPTYADGWMELSKIYIKLGDYKLSSECYQKGKEIDFFR